MIDDTESDKDSDGSNEHAPDAANGGGEPAERLPAVNPVRQRDQKIVRAAIHPSIGVARVGNSQEEYFIGPEVTNPEPACQGFYKDSAGALKRQAARFRVYGYNAAGEAVSELTADNADVTWTVHVANTKAAWYEFQLALDIPEAASAQPSERRNKNVVGADRAQLTIDPGPRSIRGRGVSGNEYHFDSGKFFDKPVYLGELRTDDAGRLIFLGGRGDSASRDGSRAEDFANNDGWHDDVSDGPVTAEVKIDGNSIPVDPAWVVVGPPNYGPDLVTIRTMHDLLYDTFVEAGSLPFPKRVSFTEQIYPILHRMSSLQWVNKGFAVQFGWNGRNFFMEPGFFARLSSSSAENQELRRQVFNTFRVLDRDGESPIPWPWIYGDSMNIPPVSARQNLALSPTQYKMLELWADGKFDADWKPDAVRHSSIDRVAVDLQPQMLDRASLDFCLADAFHPGCEMTWPMRHATMYMSTYRILHRPDGQPEPDYGDVLTPEIAVGAGGPLYAQGPGDISRWMAVPWQTDTASCRSGYYAGFGPRFDPYVPTFWPARVPNHVLTEKNYKTVKDTTRPRQERILAFNQRAMWYRGLKGDYIDQINQMVNEFGKLGVVEVREGIADDPEFPPQMMVESKPEFAEKNIPPLRNLIMLHVPEARDEEAAPRAIATAAAEVELPDEEMVVGFINKVNRFPGAQ